MHVTAFNRPDIYQTGIEKNQEPNQLAFKAISASQLH